MNLHTCLLTNNNCYKTGKIITPKGVMVHSTGANNPNLKRYVQPDDGLLGTNTNGNSWNTALPGGSQVCVHAFIGLLGDGKTVATYQTLPWNMRGWHAGKTAGNDQYISFEICEDGLSDAAYFGEVYQEAVELTAYLCGMFGWDPAKDGAVICHSEGYTRGVASNHADVMHWFPKHGKSMDTFRADVAAAMTMAADEYGCYYALTSGATGQGATGDAARAVQERLVICGYDLSPYGGVDGDYGAGTATVVAQFQADMRLTATGAADQTTKDALQEATQICYEEGTTMGKILDLINATIDERLAGEGTEPSSKYDPETYAKAVEDGLTDGSRPLGLATRQEVSVIAYRAKHKEA